MSAYLTSTNLSRAACIAGVAGLMAAPRILDRADGSLLLVFSAFPLLTIIAGTATAWGETGGMRGPFPDRRMTRPWILGAIIAGVLLLPVLLWYDSVRQSALSENDALWLANEIPRNPEAAIALILWSAGFETVLFQAGVMSFTARLTGNGLAAVAAGPVFKLFVLLLKCGESGFSHGAALAAIGITVTTGIACVLYSRAGLPAAMAFNAITSSRHLLVLACGG